MFHALSGSQHAYGYNPEVPGTGSLWKPENHEGWWNSIIGPGKPLDTDRFCIICANYLGGCYGTTGPASPSPTDGLPYGSRFPHVEAADQARLQALLLDSLGIERIHLAGPSVGGLIALSFACQFPERVRSFISIGSGYRASIEHRLSLFEQILAIELDPDFRGGDYYQGPAPKKGLAFARIIGHKSFVYQEGLEQRARKEVGGKSGLLTWMTPTRSTQSYMLHQGTKFAERFDANSYIRIADMWASSTSATTPRTEHFKPPWKASAAQGFPRLSFPLIQTAVSARRNSRISRRSLKPPIFPRSSIPSLPPRDTIPSCWSRSFMRNPSGAFWPQGSRRGRRKLFPPQEDTAEQRLKRNDAGNRKREEKSTMS
ncbi:MAG: homoserine O-acetyltransferase family protein [Akkermansia sp.]